MTPGRLTAAELREEIVNGAIDTVLVAFPDLQGRLVGKRVMMIAGNVDEVIPPSSARALWDAAGRPPITWYDCGHYSAVGFLLPAVRQTVEFFADDLPR